MSPSFFPFKQPPLIEFRKNIVELSQNGVEISEDYRFEEWLEVLYSPGLCGLDFEDVYRMVKDRPLQIRYVASKDIPRFRNYFVKELSNAEVIIAAIKLPIGQGLEEVTKIAELIMCSVSPKTEVLWQATNHNREEIKLLLVVG